VILRTAGGQGDGTLREERGSRSCLCCRVEQPTDGDHGDPQAGSLDRGNRLPEEVLSQRFNSRGEFKLGELAASMKCRAQGRRNRENSELLPGEMLQQVLPHQLADGHLRTGNVAAAVLSA
jgi:hypothetical protein